MKVIKDLWDAQENIFAVLSSVSGVRDPEAQASENPVHEVLGKGRGEGEVCL